MTGAERAEVMVRMTFGPNHGIEFSPDGTLVAATTTITARAWELATGIPEVAMDGGHDHLEAVAFDPSGTLLGLGSTDKTATIWDVTTGVPVATLAGHGSSVSAIAFPLPLRQARWRPRPGRWTASAGPGTR